MAKGQAAMQQQQTQNAAEDRAMRAEEIKLLREGTPEQQAQRTRLHERRKAIDEGHLAHLPGMVYSMSDPAERAHVREATMSIAPSGATALGYDKADPTALAMQKQYMGDQLDRDNARAFEGDVKNYISDTDAMEQGYINRDVDTARGILGNATQSSQYGYSQAQQIAASRGAWLPALVGGLAGGVGTAVGGYLGRPPTPPH